MIPSKINTNYILFLPQITQTADGVTELLAAARAQCDANQKRNAGAAEDVAIVETVTPEEARAKRKIDEIQLEDDDDEEEETVKVGGADNLMGEEQPPTNKGGGRGWYKNKKKW